MPYLEIEGITTGSVPRELNGDMIVGSGEQATWRLPGSDLAARHFLVRRTEDGYRLEPCSPQNVVVVNGSQLFAGGIRLASGDAIAAGSTRFVFLDRLSDPRPKAPPPPEPAFLLDGWQGIAYPIRGRVLEIGRELSCGVVLRDPTVSRFHADVRVEAGELVLYSVGSSGTRVNGEAVEAPRILRPRDQIQIGSSTLSFLRGPLPTGVRWNSGPPDTAAGVAMHRRPTLAMTPAIAAATTGPGTGATLNLAFVAAALLLAALALVLIL